MIILTQDGTASLIDLSEIHDTYTFAVLPAKAGIQTITKIHAGDNTTKYGFARYAELSYKLDSGLRRNDGVV